MPYSVVCFGFVTMCSMYTMLTMLPAAVTPLAVAVADKLTSSRVEVVTETIRSLQHLNDALLPLNVDASEFAFLKAVVLFAPGACLFGVGQREGGG